MVVIEMTWVSFVALLATPFVALGFGLLVAWADEIGPDVDRRVKQWFERRG